MSRVLPSLKALAARYPAEGARTLTFGEGSGRLEVKLRVPAWATGGFTVTVNGVRQRGKAVPGSYLTLSRDWRRGDRIRISAPYRLRIERALDDPAVQSVFYGPVLLVARSGETEFRAFSFYKDFTLRGDLADAWLSEGLFGRAERDKVVAAAVRADLRGAA